LSIYDKRFSIRTLELVGADWAFIQRPFVKRGLRIGMISAILASLVLAAMVFLWSSQNEVVSRYLDWSGLLWSLALINILGPFVGLITSLFTVNRYLQGGIDELFNT
jgi:cell division transport system permease protein